MAWVNVTTLPGFVASFWPADISDQAYLESSWVTTVVSGHIVVASPAGATIPTPGVDARRRVLEIVFDGMAAYSGSAYPMRITSTEASWPTQINGDGIFFGDSTLISTPLVQAAVLTGEGIVAPWLRTPDDSLLVALFFVDAPPWSSGPISLLVEIDLPFPNVAFWTDRAGTEEII